MQGSLREFGRFREGVLGVFWASRGYRGLGGFRGFRGFRVQRTWSGPV